MNKFEQVSSIGNQMSLVRGRAEWGSLYSGVPCPEVGSQARGVPCTVPWPWGRLGLRHGEGMSLGPCKLRCNASLLPWTE